jgi:SOS-response transcriptional repressor LexA
MIRYLHMIHEIQRKLLELNKERDLKNMKLQDVADLVGVKHRQQVKYHMQKAGILEDPKNTSRKKRQLQSDKIASLPIMGTANCGDATLIAEDVVEGYLPISKKLLPSGHNVNNLFVVRAMGESMNQASVNDKTIDDGDYVVIDEVDKDASDGDYVLSIINGMANIKRFTKDPESDEYILLESESDKVFPLIYIHKNDIDDYLVNGKVIDVIKSRYKKSDDIYYEPI